MQIYENVPGVKILEVRLEASPIVGVGTSTAGFVGVAPTRTAAAPATFTQFPDVAHAVNSADEFIQDYIGVPPNPAQPFTQRSTPLSRAVLGFFANGGTRCFVVNLQALNLRQGLKLLEVVDEVAILAAPGRTAADDYNALMEQAETLGDRFAILDPPPAAAVTDRNLLTMPITPVNPGDPAGLRPRNSMYAAFYYPHIMAGPDISKSGDPNNTDPAFDPPREAITPVGHIAGVYARVDSTRGVFKAPASELIRGALGVEDLMTDGDQNPLNAVGVNVLRNFTGGVTIWGARTLSDDSLWRYISTRRLVNYIEESLQDGLRWAVFEPNTLPLRQQILRSVRDFLDRVWRDGGLFGAASANAYYARFPDIYNTDAERAQGKLTLEIGLRVTFPAEFIIIRIGVITRDPAA